MDISCLCCGTCCRKYQPRLTADDVTLISKKLGLPSQQFIQDYTDHRWPGTQSFLLIHKNEACVFLEYFLEKGISLCRIHSFKPACCRDWACGLIKPECQEGLKNKFGIKVDSSDRMEASPEQELQLKQRLEMIERI